MPEKWQLGLFSSASFPLGTLAVFTVESPEASLVRPEQFPPPGSIVLGIFISKHTLRGESAQWKIPTVAPRDSLPSILPTGQGGESPLGPGYRGEFRQRTSTRGQLAVAPGDDAVGPGAKL